MWNFFKRRENVSPNSTYTETTYKAPAVHTLTPEISLKDLTAPSTILLRKMKWVTDETGQTGIIADFDASGNALIHYVHEATGETTRTAQVRVSSLRLAKFKEIPEVRRIDLSPQAAAVLGYF